MKKFFFIIIASIFFLGSVACSGKNDGSLTLNYNNASLKIGQTLLLEASSENQLVWSSEREDIVSVKPVSNSNYARIYALAEGNTKITVKTENSSVSCNIEVSAEQIKVVKESVSLDLSVSPTLQLEFDDYIDVETEMSFEVENPRLAFVTRKGVLTGKRAGSTKITATDNMSGDQTIFDVTITGELSLSNYTTLIDGGAYTYKHVQGLTVDGESKYMYFSFTDRIVKMDMQGNIVGTVEGITGEGHLGDLAYNVQDGKLYCSLMPRTAVNGFENGPYVAIFDADKIDRVGINAYTGGVMTTVSLEKVIGAWGDVAGYGPQGGNLALGGKFGIYRGLDSITFGPKFGEVNGKYYLTAIIPAPYSETSPNVSPMIQREDNNYFVIMQFDVSDWGKYARALDMSKPHLYGPEKYDNVYFFYAGYHAYQVQVMTYDEYTNSYMLGCYNVPSGSKFENFMFYMLDAETAGVEQELVGTGGERGLIVKSKQLGLFDTANNIYGFKLDFGVGLHALGNGYYYAGVDYYAGENRGGKGQLYKWNGSTYSELIDNENPLVIVNNI